MEEKIINQIKALGIDMIRNAKSGHSGIVLGAAPILYTLYANHLEVHTNDPNWVNRDRFIMSAGHGSALLYATLYMAGFDLSLDDLKHFRRIGYKTPGHPEVKMTPGVDMSTGPLGQGVASAVGMAIAEKISEGKTKFPKKNKLESEKSLIHYRIYALCGDGDLMEGVSYEAASLAGTLRLDNLMILYDSNGISLDGKTNLTFQENVRNRFASMGWHTEFVKNGTSVSQIDQAIRRAKKSGKPSFIEIKTTIGAGSLYAGSHEIHGKPLEDNDILQLKKKLNLSDVPFFIDESVQRNFHDKITKRSNLKYESWASDYREYVANILQDDTSKLDALLGKETFIDLRELAFDFEEKEATRVTNGKIMNKIATIAPMLIGGSADLSSSTKTYLKELGDFSVSNPFGRNIWFGVREHAMGAILNGLALSYYRPFGSTFLVFSDYLKPAIRMSALMNLPVTYIFTHDSINVGEDGPTHEPIEQLAMLRSIPNHLVFRPADGREIVGCWKYLLNSHHPNSLILSRIETKQLEYSSSNQVLHGGYIIQPEDSVLHGIIIATGSEVSLSIQLSHDLKKLHGLSIRVVSMPCRELFLKQDKEYREQILPKGVRVIVIEAGSSMGWESFVYDSKYLITIDHFGASGNKDEVLAFCDFDYETIQKRIVQLLK